MIVDIMIIMVYLPPMDSKGIVRPKKIKILSNENL